MSLQDIYIYIFDQASDFRIILSSCELYLYPVGIERSIAENRMTRRDTSDFIQHQKKITYESKNQL